MRFSWPSDAESVLLWAQVLLAWVLVAYFAAGDSPVVEKKGRLAKTTLRYWARGPVLLVLLILILETYNLTTASLLTLLVTLAILLPHGRAYLARNNLAWGAEFEILVNTLAVVSMAVLLSAGNGEARSLIRVPIPSTRLAAILFGLGILGLLTRGGNHVVRGILARTHSEPHSKGTPPAESSLDIEEYNRGRVIGSIERLIMVAVVAAGAYSALAFLIGAKGLIRSKKLEDHDFGEYFLIGTLSSAALAFGFGFLLRGVFALLWK